MLNVECFPFWPAIFHSLSSIFDYKILPDRWR